MRKTLLAAGIAAAALLPTFALAQQTCEQSNNNRIAGTVIGAGLAPSSAARSPATAPRPRVR
uniref:Uncharacterized protein n=1 Tax=Phenylobacterium glaciei TaxID=2803784 RepID=A0A974P5Z4_9CAUL|nr:hypothetical protein JKL49_12535 [Phenylobacterium glaciei]